jgi:hypothetical protein
MPGERDLRVLLKSMRPVLKAGEFVFCTAPDLPDGLSAHEALGLFREEEGLTLILPRERADAAGLPYTAVFRMVTLSVHSSLEAVGFLAAITRHLADHGLSVNAVSAYYHDHLFVPAARAGEVIHLLQELSEQEHDAGRGAL